MAFIAAFSGKGKKTQVKMLARQSDCVFCALPSPPLPHTIFIHLIFASWQIRTVVFLSRTLV